MTTSAVDIRHYAPDFFVSINGSRLAAEMSKTILSIRIRQEINALNDFSFEIQDEFRGGQFRWLGHDLFKYGNDVSIKLGYANHLIDMLEGKIQNIEARFFEGAAPTFTVEGSDRAYKFLMNRSGPHEFVDKSDSQIVQAIAEKAQLRATVDQTDITHPVKIKEGGIKYFEFLGQLAQENSFELRLSGRELYFGASQGASTGQLNLTWGKELINFTPEINTSQAISEVVVLSWDRSRRTTIEGRARAGEEATQASGSTASQITREIYGDVVEVVTDQPVGSNEEARQRAVSILQERSADLIRGSGDTIGMADMQPGSNLNLSGLGRWFSGCYLVEKVVHTIDANGYRTNFTATRNVL